MAFLLTRLHRQKVRYFCGLIAATAIFYLLSYPFHMVLLRWLGISSSNHGHPVLFFLSSVGFLSQWWYLPVLFWLLLWIRWRYTEPTGFSENHMGRISVLTGVSLIGASQIPNTFLPLGVGPICYRTGICFLVSGLLCLPNVRQFLYRVPLGFVVIFLSGVWGVFAALDLNLDSPSFLWPLMFVISLIFILLTLFSFRPYERWAAFLGLALLTVYDFIPSHTKWKSLALILNWIYRGPVDFFLVLGWTVVLGWALGLFKKWGHPLEAKTLNTLR